MTPRDTPEVFDARMVPDGAAHWDARAASIAAIATRRSHENGFVWIAHSRAGWAAASLLLAAALTLLVVRRDSVEVRQDMWAGSIAPVDRTGRAISGSPTPPAVAFLLLGEPVGGGP